MQEVARLTTSADAIVVLTAGRLVEVVHGNKLWHQQHTVELLVCELLYTVCSTRLVFVANIDVSQQVGAKIVSDLEFTHTAKVHHDHPDALVKVAEVFREPFLVVVDDATLLVGETELRIDVGLGEHHGGGDEGLDVCVLAEVFVATGSLTEVELAEVDFTRIGAVFVLHDCGALDGLAGLDDETADFGNVVVVIVVVLSKIVATVFCGAFVTTSSATEATTTTTATESSTTSTATGTTSSSHSTATTVSSSRKVRVDIS